MVMKLLSSQKTACLFIVTAINFISILSLLLNRVNPFNFTNMVNVLSHTHV